MANLIQEVKQSPFFSLSVDEKDAMLVILITFIDSKGCKVTSPLAYKNLSGLEAKDIFSLIVATLEEHGLPKENLVAFCADGRVSDGNASSPCHEKETMWLASCKTIASTHYWFSTVHCTGCSLQSNLPFILMNISKVWKNASRHCLLIHSNSPSTSIDILFWSELTGEDVLTSLNTSTSRWLSGLRPLEKLNASYLTMLAHLMYEFHIS